MIEATQTQETNMSDLINELGLNVDRRPTGEPIFQVFEKATQKIVCSFTSVDSDEDHTYYEVTSYVKPIDRDLLHGMKFNMGQCFSLANSIFLKWKPTGV